MSIVVAGVLPPFTLNLWQDVQAMLQYYFMRQALLASTVLSAVAGLVGYFVVLRHQAFAGESLSDVAFTGALGGAALGINPLASLLVTTIAVGVAMGGFGERLRGRDVAVGTVLAWVLGLGVLFLSLFTAHVSGTGTGFSGVTVLFGNILGISSDQTRSIALISAAVVLGLVVLCRGSGKQPEKKPSSRLEVKHGKRGERCWMHLSPVIPSGVCASGATRALHPHCCVLRRAGPLHFRQAPYRKPPIKLCPE